MYNIHVATYCRQLYTLNRGLWLETVNPRPWSFSCLETSWSSFVFYCFNIVQCKEHVFKTDNWLKLLSLPNSVRCCVLKCCVSHILNVRHPFWNNVGRRHRFLIFPCTIIPIRNVFRQFLRV